MFSGLLQFKCAHFNIWAPFEALSVHMPIKWPSSALPPEEIIWSSSCTCRQSPHPPAPQASPVCGCFHMKVLYPALGAHQSRRDKGKVAKIT